MNEFEKSPVIIIGAPRSGTNLLRDLICQAPGYATWPCDEINMIWRHGNAAHPDDALTAQHARAQVRSYIRRRFRELAASTGARTIVEKTCANSLRVEFVDRVLPECKFIFIVRDGRDAVASATQRWRAPLDWRYTLKKLRYVPVSDAPYYAARFIANRARRLINRERRLSFWGPRIPQLSPDVARDYPLSVLCALQWRECVECASQQLAALDSGRVHRLRYEDLVRRPGEALADLFAFLGDPEAAPLIDSAHVSVASIGRAREQTSPEDPQALQILTPTLTKCGYV